MFGKINVWYGLYTQLMNRRKSLFHSVVVESSHCLHGHPPVRGDTGNGRSQQNNPRQVLFCAGAMAGSSRTALGVWRTGRAPAHRGWRPHDGLGCPRLSELKGWLVAGAGGTLGSCVLFCALGAPPRGWWRGRESRAGFPYRTGFPDASICCVPRC